jgi:GT2 family glycosyltransferase
VGFAARDKESKYVLLLNNDAVLFQQGLKTLVEYAENDDRVAGLQGVVLKYGTRLIDTAGDCIDEMLLTYPIGSDKRYPWILRRPIYVSFTDGSCTLYRVKHVLNCFGNKLFVDEFFAYGDDNVLGLTLWDHGYKLVSIPEAVAEHVRKLTLGKESPIPTYLITRSRVALALITNIRYRNLIQLHVLRNSITSIRSGRGLSKYFLRALIDGIKLGDMLRSRGLFIDIYKAPLIKIPPEGVMTYLMAKGIVNKYRENWVTRSLDLLTVEV